MPKRPRIGAVLLTLSALAIAGWSVEEFWTYLDIHKAATLKETAKAALEEKYNVAQRKFLDKPVPPATVKGTMTVKNTLDKSAIDLAPYLHKMKEALGKDIILQELAIEHAPPSSLNHEYSCSMWKRSRLASRNCSTLSTSSDICSFV